MSDERRQQPTVNLQELERQLREAARARQRAQASADTLSGLQNDRIPSGSAGSAPVSPPAQPTLPLSPVQAPAPAPIAGAQSPAPGANFRPLQPPPVAAPTRDVPRANPVIPPREAPPVFQSPRAREQAPAQSYVPQPSMPSAAPEFSLDLNQIRKSERAPDAYPVPEPDPVAQGQYYEAAAYEEPAASAYDQYTEDQFPRMSVERRSGGAVKAVIWVLIIAIFGAGAYFAYPLVRGMFMPSSQTAKAPPLIKADTNPVKVEPEAQPQDNAGAPKDIFTKHANEDPKSAQMTAGAEQPVDLNAAVKDAGAAAIAGKTPIVPLVPGTGEPRPVKTVTVRADGTIIPEKSDPVLVAKAQAPSPKPAVSAPAPTPAQPALPALPPLPDKPVAESPDFIMDGPVPLPPERSAEADVTDELPIDAITTPMPVTPAPEPVDTPTPATAPAAPVAAQPAAPLQPGKDFAAQFGAPETEAKANELKARVEKQFASALSGASVAVVKGDSNGKPVFRVRAVGISRDEATAICQQVASAGGQCFVSKNN